MALRAWMQQIHLWWSIIHCGWQKSTRIETISCAVIELLASGVMDPPAVAAFLQMTRNIVFTNRYNGFLKFYEAGQLLSLMSSLVAHIVDLWKCIIVIVISLCFLLEDHSLMLSGQCYCCWIIWIIILIHAIENAELIVHCNLSKKAIFWYRNFDCRSKS